MSTSIHRGRMPRRTLQILAALLALVLLIALAVALVNREKKNTITVDFDRTVSLYEGSTVRILGVDVGTVEKITPRGNNVRVKLAWDSQYKVPADVDAVIVSPSVVGDRFVQLTPAYTGGATIQNGAHLDQSRTATPTELDETFAALDKVAVALGPDGANKNGALSETLANSAANLDGQGAEIRKSITELAKLTKTVDGSKDALFSSMEKIEQFVSALEANDDSVRSFNTSLASVSDVLADESDDLQGAVRELATALSQIQTYVADNRQVLRKNINGLTDVTESLAKQRDDLGAILKQGPKALAGLATAYNPTTGTLDTRGTIKGSKTKAFVTLTEGFNVSPYCSLAVQEDPKFVGACIAVGNIVDFLVDQVAASNQATGKSSAAVNPTDYGMASDADSLADLMGVA